MKALCRNCRKPYFTHETTELIEGFCCDECVKRKAKRLGWRLRSGLTCREFMREKRINNGHKVPDPPTGMFMWGIMPITIVKMRRFSENCPFVGQIAYHKQNKVLQKWLEEWVPNIRNVRLNTMLDLVVIIVSRDDYRFLETRVSMIATRPKKRKRNGKVPKKI